MTRGLFQMRPASWPNATPPAPAHGWVPDESETEMTEHQPHVGDIYASNDKRDIASGHLQRRRITTVHANHVCFDGGTRRITRRVLDTTVQRGYRLVRCAGNNQPAPERTYTQADMARAWREGWWVGLRDEQTATDDAPETLNPYEQEEA